MVHNFIPFAQADIGKEELDEVVDCLQSGWLTTGPRCKRFEDDFAEFIGTEHAIAINFATAGLHLSLEAIGIGPGDLVITTPFTFTATAEVVRYLGADPVFIDISNDTFNIDPKGIDKFLRSLPNNEQEQVKAILPVHFAGQSCDMDSICNIANEFNLKLILITTKAQQAYTRYC